jgi:hypothetical protein
MWFGVAFSLTMWLALRLAGRKGYGYAIAFGLAPVVAAVTGASLPISLAGLLPAPWGLLPNILLWTALGLLLAKGLMWIDRGIPESYLAAAAWGIVLAFNPQLAYQISILAGVIWAIGVTFEIYDAYRKRQEENYKYISADPVESSVMKAIARGVVLLLVFSALAQLMTAPALCALKGATQCDIFIIFVITGAVAYGIWRWKRSRSMSGD